MAEDIEAPVVTRRLRHKAAPLVTLVILASILVTLWALPRDSFERAVRPILVFVACGLAAVVLAVWFFALAGVARRTRAMAGLLLLLAAGAALSVRRVEFSGDMEPTFDFRWQESRESRLKTFLGAKTKVPPPADTAIVRPMARVRAEDSPQYRGPNRDGVVHGPALARNWAEQPPKCLWRHPCGGGYASFAVVGDIAVTIEQRGDDEAIVCYDVPTGHQQWTYAYPALFSERLGGDGPRATPTIHDGHIYSLGATGELVKLDFATGRLIWKVNILKENGSANLDWGMSGSPLIYDERIVVNPGAQKGTDTSAEILALDLNTKSILARGGKAKAGYASPTLVTLARKEQILIFDGIGLAGFDRDDAHEMWRVTWTSEFDINASQPVIVDESHVVITSYAGCALIEIAENNGAWSATDLWRNKLMKCYYTNPIARDGYLYGLDGGILACLDLKTGKRLWKDRRGQYGYGQFLLANDLLVVLSETGELALVEPSPEEYRELARIQAIEGKTWNNPVLVGGRALVRNHLEMACYELPLANPHENRNEPYSGQEASR